MPPFNVGFAQVEQRLGIVRRRLNSVAVQDAVYLGGSLVLLATALLIAVAVRGQATLFTVTVWAAGAAVVTAIGAAIWRARSRWVSREQVIRFADQRADLDDRLSTLLLDAQRVRTSRLRDILLEQILSAAPAWDVDALAPRRVPRSAYALAAAALGLILTSFLVRPPARPQPAHNALRPHPATARQPDAALQPQPGAVSRARGTGIGGSQQAGAPGGEHGQSGGAQIGQMAAKGDAGHTGAGGAEKSRAVGEPNPAQAGGEARSRGDRQAPAQLGALPEAQDAAENMTAKLQETIRQALGAPRPDAGEHKDTRSARADEQGRQPDRNPRKQNPDQADQSAGDRKASVQQPGQSDMQAGSGSAANPGAKMGGTQGELLAKKGQPRAGNFEPGGASVKLTAFAAMQPSQLEPQRQPPVDALPHGGTASGAPPSLSDEQIPDAPLQKPEVAPEHEAVVRRIYTRE